MIIRTVGVINNCNGNSKEVSVRMLKNPEVADELLLMGSIKVRHGDGTILPSKTQ